MNSPQFSKYSCLHIAFTSCVNGLSFLLILKCLHFIWYPFFTPERLNFNISYKELGGHLNKADHHYGDPRLPFWAERLAAPSPFSVAHSPTVSFISHLSSEPFHSCSIALQFQPHLWNSPFGLNWSPAYRSESCFSLALSNQVSHLNCGDWG